MREKTTVDINKLFSDADKAAIANEKENIRTITALYWQVVGKNKVLADGYAEMIQESKKLLAILESNGEEIQ